eukprot:629947-Hanusia_phi.AAC.3
MSHGVPHPLLQAYKDLEKFAQPLLHHRITAGRHKVLACHFEHVVGVAHQDQLLVRRVTSRVTRHCSPLLRPFLWRPATARPSWGGDEQTDGR